MSTTEFVLLCICMAGTLVNGMILVMVLITLWSRP